MKEANHKSPHVVGFHSQEIPRVHKSIETERSVVTEGLGRRQDGNEQSMVCRMKFLWGMMKML